MRGEQKVIMLGDNVMVKMDPENEFVQTPNGFKLFIDTTYEPEKHMVRTGIVEAVPKDLSCKDFPWVTENEIQVGDKVVMYYLAIQNCLAPERRHFIKKGKTMWIFIKYNNIYVVVRDDKIIPINGYVLVEPIEDPDWEAKVAKAEKAGLALPDLRGLSKTHVTYGRVAYTGKPIAQYKDEYKSDKGIDVKPGDEVVIKKIRDIPMEYEYHAKLDGGRKLLRMQRHNILAVL